MLVDIADDEDCLAGLAVMVSDIRNARLGAEAQPYLLASRLVPAPKGVDGVRPIAVGEVLYKLAALHALSPLADTLTELLQPIQFGVGVRGGSEAAVLLLQALLVDPSTPRAGMACDFRNAFNEVDRAVVLERLFEQPRLRSMWRVAHWAYSSPSPLWVYDRRGVPVHRLESANGVRQGDLLAAALFALAVQPIYASALAQVPGASAVGCCAR
jgi:hypothetical protein